MKSLNEWLPEFVRFEYFTPCSNCTEKKDASRPEVPLCKKKKTESQTSMLTNFFCIDCCKGPLCKGDKLAEHEGHNVLQVRKVTRSFGVKVSEIKELLNIEGIEQYKYNGDQVLFLPCRGHKPPTTEPYYCIVCNRILKNSEKFCSIACKMKIAFDRPFDTLVTLVLTTGVSTCSDQHVSIKEEEPVIVPPTTQASTCSGLHVSIKEEPVTSVVIPRRKRSNLPQKKRISWGKAFFATSNDRIDASRPKKKRPRFWPIPANGQIRLGPNCQVHIADLEGGMFVYFALIRMISIYSRKYQRKYKTCKKEVLPESLFSLLSLSLQYYIKGEPVTM